MRSHQLPLSFILTGGVIALSLALPLPQRGTIAGMPSICPFFNLTGVPCPGCGLTRSFVCVGHGHFAAAFRWHPLGPVLFAGALLYLGGTLARWTWPGERWIAAATGVALLVFWGLRLGGVFPLPS